MPPKKRTEAALEICLVCDGWSGPTCEFCGHVRGTRYRVIAADPPWRGNNAGNRAAPGYKGPQREKRVYKTMPHDAICGMADKVKALAADDAFLFLWAPHILVLDFSAQEVALAWGFTPKQELPWEKLTQNGRPAMGLGNYTRLCTEPCLLCTRGTPKVRVRNELNKIEGPRGAHSAKPDAFYEKVQRLCHGPYLELFARRRYNSQWVTHGNQAPNRKRKAA